ncbi:MAG: YkgJ family cysteine cluster protein [Thermodesulfovibrionia bacterium]|nr:YkgJ family cysteine cluster protein [Thermodesulfovibrionia bacterium]
MSVTKRRNRDTNKGRRLSFAHDEKVHHWLSKLLEAYHIVDKGLVKAIEAEQKRGRTLACSKGCSSCCHTQKDIPVYPLELVGISWYVTEKISGPVREALKEQLKNYRENDSCPLLIEQLCTVHPMRPMGCRQFNVFGRPCTEGEDPYYTRREDVLPPVKKHVDQAFFIILPFYGVEKESERVKVVERGAMHKVARRMQTCNWKSLAEKMHTFDRNSEER